VCRLVLNLLAQVRDPPTKLRLGLRLSRYSSEIGTLFIRVGSKPVVLHHEHSRVKHFISHIFILE